MDQATVNAGYGAVINLPNGDKKVVFNYCESFCSNYIAEQYTITTAVIHINFHFDTNPLAIADMVIFTYSLFSLDALENGTDTSKYITYLSWSLHHLLSNHQKRVVLQWIAAPCGIPGNERADALAKKGANLPQPENPVKLPTVHAARGSNLI